MIETVWSRISCLVSFSLDKVSNCIELCIVTAHGYLVYFAFKIYVVIIRSGFFICQGDMNYEYIYERFNKQ